MIRRTGRWSRGTWMVKSWASLQKVIRQHSQRTMQYPKQWVDIGRRGWSLSSAEW